MGKIFFDIEICKRGRKCGMCGDPIPKGSRFFLYQRWLDEQLYPSSKNVCEGCAEFISNDEFTDFLKSMLSGIGKVKVALKSE